MTAMIAINGLLINNSYMDIISNNIANASTIGYKSSHPIFFDIFSRSFYSNSNVASGVGISNIIQNFNNGISMETGRNLDLSIQQDGFFRLLDSQGHVYYTRNGQFLIDKNKNIINMQGMYLTGRNKSYLKNNLNNLSNLEPINLKNAYILPAKATSSIQLSASLNSNVESMNQTDGSDDLSQQADYVREVTIYNEDEKTEKLTISFKKTDKNTWKVNVESENSSDSSDQKKNISNSFDLKFDSKGELVSNKLFNIQSKNAKNKNITLDLTGTVEQAESDSSYQECSQDGYMKGSLKTFNILFNGEIVGKYSNDQTAPMGQILLSKFISPEKLNPESGSLWSANAESGPGNPSFGILTEKTLETSNVDLNKELINMIIAQRNYQSNAQSFKTEDKIINTLLNLR